MLFVLCVKYFLQIYAKKTTCRQKNGSAAVTVPAEDRHDTAIFSPNGMDHSGMAYGSVHAAFCPDNAAGQRLARGGAE